MSFSQVRSYFKTRIAALDAEFEEHEDAFNQDNIGAYNFNKAYHVFYSPVSSGPLNHSSTDDSVTALVSLFFSGDRTPQAALDTAMDFANTYRLACVKPENAMVGTNIKNVVLNNIVAEPLESNDNAIVIRFDFTVRMVFGP
jgi:hypothetical protein